MTRNTSRLAPLVIAIIIIFSDATVGLFDGGLRPEVDADDLIVDVAETSWEGGGPLRLLVDPMDGSLERHYASMDDPHLRLDDYYGGAVPGDDDDAQRWRHEPYRWGHSLVAVASKSPSDVDGAWQHGGSAWQYGDGAYQGGALAELVSPAVDLRSVPDHDRTSNVALTLRHAYDFEQVDNVLRDGGRVELSFLDPVANEWAPWQGIQPTYDTLHVGDGEVQGRLLAPDAQDSTPVHFDVQTDPGAGGAANGSARIDTEKDQVATLVDPILGPQTGGAGIGNGAVSVGAGDGGPLVAQGPNPVPHPFLYQGLISSTAGSSALDQRDSGWSGFGGRSGDWSVGIPWVESVFDLSDHAGHLIRLRFIVSTSTPSFSNPEDLEEPEAWKKSGEGWLLDHAEIHAAGPIGVDILGLASPGDGAVVAPNRDFDPVVGLQNRGPDPVDVEVTFRAGSSHDTRVVRIGTASLGRAFVESDASFHELLGVDDGDVPAGGVERIDVQVRVRHDLDDDVGQASMQSPGPLSRSYHVLVGDGAGIEATGLEFFRITTSQGKQVEQRRSDLHAGEAGRIYASIANLASQAVDLDLTGEPDAGQRSLFPVLLDDFGIPVGDIVPDGPSSVNITASRTTSGTLGEPAEALQVSWTWDGSPDPRPLNLVLRDEQGNTVLDGGLVLVDSSRAPPLDENYGNPWSWDGCRRHDVVDGVRGVLRCPRGESVNSSVSSLLAFDLPEGGDINLTLTYRGGPLNVTLYHNETRNPGTAPAATVTWTSEDAVGLDKVATWQTTSVQTGSLDAAWSGWVRVQIETEDDVDLDEIVLELVTTRDGQVGRRVLTSALFDVTARAARDVIEAAPDSRLAHLDGVDEWHNGTVGGNVQGVYPGTMVEDAILLMPAPLDFGDVGRPVLRFQHWHSLGGHGVAVVEAARAPVDDAPLDAGPPSAGDAAPPTDLTWTPLTTFRGSSAARLEDSSVALWDFAGERVHLRFRYHLEPAQAPPPRGWVITDVRVEGQTPAGPGVAYEEPINEYGLRGGSFVDEYGLPNPSLNRWHEPTENSPEPYMQVTRDDSRDPNNQNIVPVTGRFQTGAVDLTGMTVPVLTVRHSGHVPYYYPPAEVRTNCQAIEHANFGLQYQVGRPDGTWGPWVHATPPNAEPKLVDPETEKPVGAPFTSAVPPGERFGKDVHPEDCKHSISGGKNVFTGFVFEDALHRFDLRPLLQEGSEARFSMTAQGNLPWTIIDSIKQLDALWTLHSLQVADGVHVTDAAVTDITVEGGDAEGLRQTHPELLSGDQHVLANEQANVHVEVRNQGKVDLQVRVDIVADHEKIGLSWRSEGSNGFVDTGQPTAVVDLPARGVHDTVMDLRFLADFTSVPPGDYNLTARVTILNGVDTDLGDDLQRIPVRLLPLRDLRIDVGASAVDPFIAPADAERTLRTRIVNQGNIVEDDVIVAAELVKMTSLTEFEPLEPRVALGVQHYRLAPRSTGIAECKGTSTTNCPAWDLGPAQFDTSILEPGQKYAAMITAHPGAESLTQWWGTQLTGHGSPVLERGQGGAIVNLTRMPVAECYCALAPFLAESTVQSTDLSIGNSTTRLPLSYPKQALVDDWQATTLLQGEPLPEGDDGLPRWRFVDAAQATEVFPGKATGNAWLLPAHEGRESLTHILTSPALPAHIIDPGSRAILDVRHASGLEPGQARLEVRTRAGADWSEWTPSDHIRTKRVAVVLDPAFPAVNPNNLTSGAGGYRTPIPNHPLPPFYENTLNKTYIDDGAKTCVVEGASPGLASRCSWTPLRQDQFTLASNQAWLQALNSTLLALEANGMDVALFTTGPHDLRINHTERQGGLFYDLTGAAGATRSFPLASMSTLGLRMDTYGAILVVGDGVTLPFAGESGRLRLMSHGIDDPVYNTTIDPIFHDHQADLEAILRAAPKAGVGVVGAMGPAVAAMARSGIAEGANVAVWQTFPGMPETFGSTAQLRCTLQSSVGRPTATGQPLPACLKSKGQNFAVDQDHPGNYLYYSAHDAQSLALLDLVQAGGARVVEASGDQFGTGFANGQMFQSTPPCPTTHPLVSSFQACNVYTPSVVSHPAQGGRPAIVTAGWPTDSGVWAANIVAALQGSNKGLPVGDGTWGSLPAELSYPVGGRFTRNADGSDRFEGQLMQFRIVIESDPAVVGGHGAFAVDGLTLMGSNRTRGLGVEVVQPLDGHSYDPGTTLPVVIQVNNRGTQSTGADKVHLDIGQQIRGVPNECQLPDVNRITLDIDSLEAGEVTAVRVPREVFPGLPKPGPECTLDADQQDNWVWFNASLKNAGDRAGDDDAVDDVHHVMVHGRRIVNQASVQSVTVSPNQLVSGSQDPVVQVQLRNDNTQDQQFNVRVRVEHARPLPCLETGLPGNNQAVHGCGPDGEVVAPLLERNVAPILGRDATRSIDIPLDLSDGIGPGVYRVTASVSYPVVGASTVTPLPQTVRWLHVAADADPVTARSIMPPDGGLAADWNDLSGLPPALPRPPGGQQWHPVGFTQQGPIDVPVAVDPGTRTHTGAYGPDQTTRDSAGNALRHGWAVHQCSMCSDSTASYLEWRRDGTPSYLSPPDPRMVQTPNQQPFANFEALGMADFGPDRVIWQPYDTSETKRQDIADVPPYLSLASFERPVLSLLTRFSASPNTALVVEMEVAQRTNCNQGGTQSRTVCPDNANQWQWTGNWLPLVVGNPDVLQAQLVMPRAEEGAAFSCGADGVPFPPNCVNRNGPSNPLGNTLGIWGGQSGVHDGDGNWQRVVFPIDLASLQSPVVAYCNIVAGLPAPQGGEWRRSDMNPCQYAHGMGGTAGQTPDMTKAEDFTARPVRFRFSAASYGGDAGVSSWQIADVALTEHQVSFVGPHEVAVEMEEAETMLRPILIRNTGAVDDVIEVRCRPTYGRTGLGAELTVVELLASAKAAPAKCDFSDSQDPVLAIALAPGEARPIWVRITSDIMDNLFPGSTHYFPFLVEARSQRSPTVQDTLLVKAEMLTTSWPDIAAVELLVDGLGHGDGFLRRSVHDPIQTTLRLRNDGDRSIGGEDNPIHARLIAQLMNTTTGKVVSESVVHSLFWDEAIKPAPAQDTFIPFPVWTPTDVGAYRLRTEVNRPDLVEDGAMGLLEKTKSNNDPLPRDIVVGPVSFADLHVTDTWLVPLEGNGCGQQRVDRAVAGHAYCVAALVENRGRASALGPSVEFGIGANAAFSAERRFADAGFPGGTSMVVHSSPWTAALRGDGTGSWTFYVDVGMNGFSPNPENKTRQFPVHVDAYSLHVEDAPDEFHAKPGREVTFAVNLTNKGTAPATPVVRILGAQESLRVHVEQAPRLLPQERGQVNVVVRGAHSLQIGDEAPTISFTTMEDPKVDAPLATRLVISDDQAIDASAVAVRSAPGDVRIRIALDNADGARAVTWRVEEADQPLHATHGWHEVTSAYERELVDLPATIASHTPPGTYLVNMTLGAQRGQVVERVPILVPVQVEPMPELDATVAAPATNTTMGKAATIVIHLQNPGNVLLHVDLSSQVEAGTITNVSSHLPLLLHPGHEAEVQLRVAGEPVERVLGNTSVRWREADEPGPWHAHPDLFWQVNQRPGGLKIVETDLDEIRLRPHTLQVATLRVSNTATTGVDAEVLAVVDGIVEGLAATRLEAEQQREVRVPFRSGEAGQAQQIMLVLRPAGSDAPLDDPAFYAVGDAAGRVATPEGRASLAIPGSPLALLAAAFVLLTLRRRGAL